jgi:hypothetical protein
LRIIHATLVANNADQAKLLHKSKPRQEKTANAWRTSPGMCCRIGRAAGFVPDPEKFGGTASILYLADSTVIPLNLASPRH